jgi:autotransporter-associated beta strand protein
MHAQSRSVKRNRLARRSAGLILAEALEPRILMSNRTWDGGGGAADTAWSHAVNWQGDVAPVAGDALFFPATGVTNRTSVNDLAADTSIIGITIDGSSAYTISGSRIALGAGGITVLGNAAHTFTIPVALNNLGSSITVSDLATFSVSGPFTGAGPLAKGGNGRLEITGDSPDFAGAVDVNAGVVRVSSPLALGNTTGQTFVVDFATLLVGAGASGSTEQLFIGGSGAGNQGALHAEGTSNWAGAVQITGDATTIAVDTGANFTVSGAVGGSGSSPVLNKAGAGRLILSGSAVGGMDVNVNTGALQLAGVSPNLGDTVVASGAVLEITGGRNATVASLSLTGSGTGAGALLNVSGNNSITGPVTLAGSTTIGSTAGTLTLTGTLNTGSGSPSRVLTVTGAGGVNIGGASGSGAISGTGSITKTGTGTLTLAAPPPAPTAAPPTSPRACWSRGRHPHWARHPPARSSATARASASTATSRPLPSP